MWDTTYFQNLKELLKSFNTAQLWKESLLHKNPLTLKYQIYHTQNYLNKNCVIFLPDHCFLQAQLNKWYISNYLTLRKINFNVKTIACQTTKNKVKVNNLQPKVFETSTKIIPVLPLLHQPEVTCSLSGTVIITGDNGTANYNMGK